MYYVFGLNCTQLPTQNKESLRVIISPSVFLSNISLHGKPEDQRRHSEVEVTDSDLHICVNCMSALVNTSVRWGREFVCMVFDICMLCACTYDAIYARVSSALAYYVCVGGGGGGGGRRDQPHSCHMYLIPATVHCPLWGK